MRLVSGEKLLIDLQEAIFKSQRSRANVTQRLLILRVFWDEIVPLLAAPLVDFTQELRILGSRCS